MVEGKDAGSGEGQRTPPFRVLRGGRGVVETRHQRRWKRPERRQAARASLRRPFRWGRGRQVLGASRWAGVVRTNSRRKRAKRQRSPPLRSLEREAIDRLRRTASQQ